MSMTHRFTPMFALLGCLLAGSLAGAQGLYVDEDFSQWPAIHKQTPLSTEQNGWRVFATADMGSMDIVQNGDGQALRLTRASAAGDMGVDRWEHDLRALVSPGEQVFVRVWARRVGAAATLWVSLHEFDGDTYLSGLDHSNYFTLSDFFEPYQFLVTLSGSTDEVSTGLRVQGTGTLEVARVEVGKVVSPYQYVNEDFETGWSGFSLTLPNVTQNGGWRVFGVGGAGGSVQAVSTAEGTALRLTRTNTDGDAAVDKDLAGLRLMPPPGTALRVSVRARWSGSAASLRVSLAELDIDGNFLGAENQQVFDLTGEMADYSFTLTTGAQTRRLNAALRVHTTGTVDVESVRVELAAPGAPVIQLPQGWTPNAEPTLYWDASARNRAQIQLAADQEFSSLAWDSGELAVGGGHYQLPAFGDGQRQFARVRVQDFDDQWSGWSEPTLIVYQPVEPLAAQTITVYDLSPVGGVAPEQAFEQAHLVAALQGLANRTAPRLFVRYMGADSYWLGQLSEEGRWMENVTLDHMGAALGSFERVETGDGAAIRIVRTSASADAGLDRSQSGSYAAIDPSTAVTLSVVARRTSSSAQMNVQLAEFDGTYGLLAGNDHFYSLGSAFTTYSFSLTTSASTGYVSPGLRVQGTGTIEIQSVTVTRNSDGHVYFSEDFEQLPDFHYDQPGHWSLEGWRMFGVANPSLESLVSRFSTYYNGVVLWDPSVPATSNVASTVAGVEGLLPIALRDVEGSLYRRLVTGGPQLPVVVNLAGKFTGSGTIPDIGEASSGSAKNDAYRWACARYLETGLCTPSIMGYYIDYYWINDPYAADRSNNTLTNHDYVIANKGFMWDLYVWGDDAPNDDPAQTVGTDLATLRRIMTAAANQLPADQCIQVCGFTPWVWKYCDEFSSANGSHGGVETEWETVRVLSNYNAYIDADALGLSGLVNASFYSHLPKPVHYNQAPAPGLLQTQERGWLAATGSVAARNYLVNYVGDYDSAAWVMTQVPAKWDHFRRNELTLSWAWGPQLMQRGAPMFDQYVRQARPADAMWCADNGAGYLNPTQLYEPRESGLPDGTDRWVNYSRGWLRRMGIRHQGFVIDGSNPIMSTAQEDLYEKITGDGMVSQSQYRSGGAPHLVGNYPVVGMAHNSLDFNTATAAGQIAALCSASQAKFLPLRQILRDPEYNYFLRRDLKRNYPSLDTQLLTPGEFFYVMRQSLGGGNTGRALYVADTMPATVGAGQSVSATVWVRNVGWETWSATGGAAVQLAAEFTPSDARQSPTLFALPRDVPPGGLVAVEVTLTAPSSTGQTLLRVDLLRGSDEWFDENGTTAWAGAVLVEAAVPEVEVSPTTLSFGEQTAGAGAGSPLEVTIHNTGTGPLSFTGAGITLAGAQAGQFAFASAPDTSALAAGAQRTVQVIFQPTAAGAIQAQLRVLTDDADEAMVIVTLTGTAVENETSATLSWYGLE